MSKLNLGRDLYLKGRIGWRGLSKDEYLAESNYKIINATALMDGFVDWNNCGFISKERYEESDEIMLQEGDILISKDGTLGKIGYVKGITTPCTVASGIFVLRNTIPDILNFDYLYHVLKSHIFKDFIARNKVLGSTIPHLYQRDLENFELDLPDINEQERIASILNDIDSKIFNSTEICDILEKQTKLLYNYWFVQFDFPDENGRPYKSTGGKMVWNDNLNREIPERWTVRQLGEVLDLLRDGTHNPPKRVEDGIPLLTGTMFGPLFLDYSQATFITEKDYQTIHTHYKPQASDIILTKIGTLGNVNYLRECDIPIAIHCNSALLRFPDCMKGMYSFLYCKSEEFQKRLRAEKGQSVQEFCSLESIGSVLMIVPEEKTIREFNKKTKSILNGLERTAEENQQLAELRDFLLPMLMNGQVKVGEEKKATVYEFPEEQFSASLQKAASIDTEYGKR